MRDALSAAGHELSKNKILDAATQPLPSLHFTAFCFQLPLSTNLPFSPSPFLLLPFSPLKLTDLLLGGLHQGTSFLVLKKQAAQSWHSPVTSPPRFNQKTSQEHKS